MVGLSLVIIFGVAFVVVLYVAISLIFVIYIRRSVARRHHLTPCVTSIF